MKKVMMTVLAGAILTSATQAAYAQYTFCTATCLISDKPSGAYGDLNGIRKMVTASGNSKAEALEQLAANCQDLLREYNKKREQKSAQLITSFDGFNSSNQERVKYDFNASAACAE